MVSENSRTLLVLVFFCDFVKLDIEAVRGCLLMNYFKFVFLGFVIVAPGYPEEVVVECIEPEGYPDIWSYDIWLKGRWTNLGNISKCIDPNRCYDSPPLLPADFTVVWNETTDKPNTVNTSLVYSCGSKCRINKKYL